MSEYEPYGKEWRDHFRRIKKEGIIDHLEAAYKAKKSIETAHNNLLKEIEDAPIFYYKDKNKRHTRRLEIFPANRTAQKHYEKHGWVKVALLQTEGGE